MWRTLPTSDSSLLTVLPQTNAASQVPPSWEREFAGVVFTPAGKPDGALNLGVGVLKLIRRGDGLADGAVASNYYITAGMDGTFGYRPGDATFTGSITR